MTDRSRSENADHRKTTHNLRTGVPTMKETKPIMETPPLTRAGRKLAEAKVQADGRWKARSPGTHSAWHKGDGMGGCREGGGSGGGSEVREVHGVVVTEWKHTGEDRK
jgi:hypothetical protein